METETLTVEEVRALAERTLRANGCDAENAGPIADNMARAEAQGAKSHGLFRLAPHVKHLKGGVANGAARPRAHATAPGVIRVEGDRAFAPVAHAAGLPPLAEAARAQGIAALAIADVIHIAALWPEASALAEEGLVAMAMTSSPPYVAPAGGARPFFGTNPMAFAWPRGAGRPPMVFDQAAAHSARGEIMLAAREGHPAPEGAGIDAQGNPTTDPEAILAGAQLPFGGYKGAAIALMIDLLAGPLMGETASHEAEPAFKGALVPGGELVIALDPVHFGAAESWRAHGERLFAAMTAEEGVRLPGDRRAAARARTEAEGVQVPRAMLDEIRALAEG
jgi:delta1-piperideine-2-carboxylate reductase